MSRETNESPVAESPNPRRRFLRSTTALIGAAAGGAPALAQTAASPANETLPVPESMKAPGAPVGGKLYGEPSPFERKAIRNVNPNLPQYISASSSPSGVRLDAEMY